jgi:hypothetical protein
MGTCLFAWFVGCSSDDSSTTSTSTGAAGSTSSTTGGGKGGSGGSTTMATGGSAGTTSTGGSAGSAGSGGSTGGTTGGSAGGSADASTEGGGGCQTACDCSDGVGCFNGECRSDLSAVYCCSSNVCTMSVFSEALCQRKDKSFSRCGGIADAGGKDGSIADICPFFSCASGMMCPPECHGTCDMNDMCRK